MRVPATICVTVPGWLRCAFAHDERIALAAAASVRAPMRRRVVRSAMRPAPDGCRLDEIREDPPGPCIAVRERLGVPLHGHQVAVVAALECFDKPIGRFRGGNQSVSQLAYTLMMHAVHAKRAGTHERREPRSLLHVDLVREKVPRMALRSEREVVVLDGAWQLARDVLIERSTSGDVDELHAAADAEHRLLILLRPARERHLDAVPVAVRAIT